MLRLKSSRWWSWGLIALGLGISSRPAQAQSISFLRQFAASGLAHAVAFDATGFYMIGGTGAGGFVRKYDLGGSELWTSGPVAAASAGGVTVDATGVYFAGSARDDALTFHSVVRKYDAGGNELWTRQFSVSGFETAAGVAAGTTAVYMAGSTRGSAAGTLDLIVRELDAGGNERWVRRSGPARAGAALAADATGVYVFGASDTDALFLRRYDAGGNELWVRQFGRTGLVSGAAADGGGVYVAGGFCCEGSAFVRKYGAGGDLQWSREFGHLSSEVLSGVTADGTGIYVAGAARHALPGQCYGGAGDAFVRKYDVWGNELWTRQFGTSASESGWAVAVDATGIYVIGSRDNGLFLAKLVETPATADSKPRIWNECVLNAASSIGGGVAPGEIVTILGSGLGPPQLVSLRVTGEGHLDTTLAGTRILFSGVPAPLVYVSGERSSAIVPFGVAGQPSVDVQVEYQGTRSGAVTVPVLDSRLGIFTADASGAGQAAIVNEDGSLNSAAHPAARGSVIAIYATGGGVTDPPGVDGLIAGDTPAKLTSPVGLTLTDIYEEFCGGPAGLICPEVLFAGQAPGAVTGLIQINARIPEETPAGDAVSLHAGSGEQTLTIAIR